jgi:predicted permease
VRPDLRQLDDEIRGHLALSVKDRIERGEDPEAARLAALRELGYVPAIRESMRRVWYSRWLDAAGDLAQDIRIAGRSLQRAKGLTATVVVTLALGIGANAAIFSVVRGVLLRPLVNRDEDRLVYIRQNAPGLGAQNITFSVPEIDDFKTRATTVGAFGDFSTIDFTLVGLGPPRVVRAGVVGGAYFDVMGLRPAIGRLIEPKDDGPDAIRVAVLTHRFWRTSLNGDPAVIGKTIVLGSQATRVVGILEPSVPYPADTDIVANMVSSPHHLGATMVTSRTHRMTELFARLAPGATIEEVRAELTGIHAAMMREHPQAYATAATVGLRVTPLRDQITAPARTILLVLLAAAALVFVIACSNVANLILARSIRREGELAVRAALGASRGALRRTLLAEGLVLCGAGAALGVLLARPLVALVGRFVSRFSVRALEVSVDGTVLWVGAGLAIVAAVLLAFIPRLPSTHDANGLALASGSIRITPTTTCRLHTFAAIQVAFSFVLLAGAGTLLATVLSLGKADTAYETRQVLAFDIPTAALGITDAREMALYQSMTRRVAALPGIRGAALGSFVPWRDAGSFPRFQFASDGQPTPSGKEHPFGRLRIVGPGYFAVVGLPVITGRDFTDHDRAGSELVVVVSQSVAERISPDGHAVNRTITWVDPLFGKPRPRRIVGVVPDVDDERVIQGPALTIYHPVQQMPAAGRLFVHASGDPYAMVPAITRAIQQLSPEQPVERAATLDDVRADLIAPERLNAWVVSGFAGVALLVAAVGVMGVLAFGVSARIRELGVRLAIGSTPRRLLLGVMAEGARLVALGIGAGAAGGYLFARIAVGSFGIPMPGPFTLAGAALVLMTAAVLASLMPAARAARVDVLQALKVD